MGGSEQNALQKLDQLGMFVLDVLQHDVAESVPSIVNLLNNAGCIGWRDFWPHDFTKDEVLVALRRLVDEKSVSVFCEDRLLGELVPADPRDVDIEREWEALWFGRTDHGRGIWNRWEPPT